MDTIFALITALALLWGIFSYNRLVRDHKRVLAAWSDIDVQLKRRHDLLPKLVEAVKQYASYEQATLLSTLELRVQAMSARQVSECGERELALAAGIQRLLVLAEAYPDLKANQNFLDLQRNISEVENYIQYARRYYNGSVRNLNSRIDSFPDLLVAKAFGYHHAEFFAYER
ncbi:LemA family protein [Nitrincola iocasae]|uniref:LemA family protein n=1 Tax=Nitrincola iocasae TaxID=2614693 RepID=A0A5J6LA26_9GAMM|nr:LemA family protein [Nitrincola iocasae]QEW05383.1 LemA family protein [Nitrincola iocasae]